MYVSSRLISKLWIVMDTVCSEGPIYRRSDCFCFDLYLGFALHARVWCACNHSIDTVNEPMPPAFGPLSHCFSFYLKTNVVVSSHMSLRLITLHTYTLRLVFGDDSREMEYIWYVFLYKLGMCTSRSATLTFVNLSHVCTSLHDRYCQSFGFTENTNTYRSKFKLDN